MENWTSEEIENIKSLLFSQDERNIYLGLELLQTKPHQVYLFATVLNFLEKVVADRGLKSLVNDIILGNIETSFDEEISKGYEIITMSKFEEKSSFNRAFNAYQPLKNTTESYLNLNPKYSLFYNKIAWYLAGQTNRSSESIEYFEKYLDWMPNDAHTHFDYAYSLNKSGENYKKIIKHYEKSIELGLNDVAVFHNLGKVYASINNFQKAEKLFRQGLKIAPNFANSYIELAGVVANRNLEEAASLFLKALDLEPRNALGWNNLACLYWEDFKIYDKAMHAVRQALKIKPKKALYWHTLAEVEWYGFNNRENAINALLRAKKMDPEYTGGDDFLEELKSV